MKVGILGNGAYGMALSNIMADNNCDITMWTKFIEEKNIIEKTRMNEKYLPKFKLPNSIKITTNIKECLQNKDLIIMVIPAAFIDELCLEMKPYINNNHILIATKGIEQETGLFINQILEKHLNTKNIGVLSGPTYAVDLIQRMPAGLTIASKSSETIKLAKRALQNSYIKLRETDDVIGTEICGSIKNVIAISAGILKGLQASESTQALLISEALHDMEQILSAFSCNTRTVLSYAGIGDLLLTCTSTKSRNYTFGRLLGEKTSKTVLDNYIKNNTIEGFYTLKSIYKLLKDKKISIPIVDLIYDIVIEGKEPEKLLIFLIEK